MVYWLVTIFILLMLLGVPIAVAMGMAGFITILINSSLSLLLIPLRFFSACNSFLLIAIPLFLLVGNVLTEGGASEILFNFADSLVGFRKGGLGYANIVGSMIFGGISGSSTADAAGLGVIEVNSMVKRGYPRDWSAGVTVASSTLAIIIPPSIIMVIYAVTAGQSAVKCLLAGLLPGIVITTLLMFVWYIVSKNKNFPISQPFSLKNIFEKFKKAWLILIIPIGFLVGLMFGIYTPTEGAAIISVYSLILTCFIHKTLGFKQLQKIFIATVKISSSILLLICASSVCSYIIANENLPHRCADAILAWVSNPILILVIINLFFLLCGCFMEGLVVVLLLTPIFLPVFIGIGINPIHAGVIMITNLAIGLITPPIGICLFATSSATGIPLESIIRVILPFIASMLIALIIINVFPWLSLVIPSMIK